jgi:hypothetical protein
MLHAGFLIGLLLGPQEEVACYSKRRLTFNGLHGVVSEETELFTTIAVRTSNPCIHNAMTWQLKDRNIGVRRNGRF